VFVLLEFLDRLRGHCGLLLGGSLIR